MLPAVGATPQRTTLRASLSLDLNAVWPLQPEIDLKDDEISREQQSVRQ